jgi:hypothetical protein
MAVEQGTATNFLDFYNKLRDFLTTNADLVTAGEEWTQIYGSVGTLTLDDEIVVQGPGLAGTDEIRVRLQPAYDAVANRYNLSLYGLPNWNPALAPIDQFNHGTARYMHLWNSSIPYTFVANGRRFVAVAQITSVVEACYAGFFLPYALPDEYPYPMAVGGSSTTSTWLYSESSVAHSHFVNPSGSLQVYGPNNAWIAFTNFTQGSGNSYQFSGFGSVVMPYQTPNNDSSFRGVWSVLRECFGGAYPLHPLILATAAVPTAARLGVLDGCYHVPGIGNSHGSLLDIDAPGDHMVVQNVARTDNWLGYWALKLE